jgi:hypothetical protein
VTPKWSIRLAVSVLAVLVLAVALYAWRRHRATRVGEYKVGGYADLTKKLREQARTYRTQCDEGPPSEQEKANWQRMRKPRALSSVSYAELAKQDDNVLVSEAFSRVLDRLYTVGFDAMARAEQDLYLANTLESEVFNGGFHQFFSNSSGNCAMQTASALARIGDTKTAAIYSRALAVFPSGKPSEDRGERGDQMDGIPGEFEAWSNLDDEYYAMGNSSAHVARYIRSNIDQFQ